MIYHDNRARHDILAGVSVPGTNQSVVSSSITCPCALDTNFKPCDSHGYEHRKCKAKKEKNAHRGISEAARASSK